MLFSGSYLSGDVHFLLEQSDIPEISIEEKESLLQKNFHYSETLTKEIDFDSSYIDLFYNSVSLYKRQLATALLRLTTYLASKPRIVLVSLARAGTPFGVLFRRLLLTYFSKDVSHYSISIIKEKGLDRNAFKTIVDIHGYECTYVFVDGWTGKGSIFFELNSSMKQQYPDVSYQFLCISDIAGVTDVCATRSDILIPSSLLNSTVSGLISRTLINSDKNRFHRVKYFEGLSDKDLSLWFVNELEQECGVVGIQGDELDVLFKDVDLHAGFTDQILALLARHKIASTSLLKPGLGETIRMLIRRGAGFVLVRNQDELTVRPIIHLAKMKNVPVFEDSSLWLASVGVLNN
jgi:hypothetical protein